jgi:hypothetical protein
MSKPSVIERQAVRAILLTRAHEVLLLRIRPPDCDEPFWIAPGGGLEPGESIVEGLRRELRGGIGSQACTAWAMRAVDWSTATIVLLPKTQQGSHAGR